MHKTTSTTPAKVCLAGEYSDWMGGQALVAALASLSTRVEISDLDADDGHFVSSSSDKGFHSCMIARRTDHAIADNHPLRHLIAVIQEFSSRYKLENSLSIRAESTIPTSGGLSSSAAISVALSAALLKHHKIECDQFQVADIAYRAERDRVVSGCGTQDQIIVSLGGVKLFTFMKQDEYPKSIVVPTEELDYFVVVASPGGSTTYESLAGDLRQRFETNERRISAYRELNKTLPGEIMQALIERDSVSLLALSRFSREAIKRLIGISNAPMETMIEIAERHGATFVRPSGPRPSGGVMSALAMDFPTASAVAKALEPLSSFVIIDRFGVAGVETH